jgi:hypothetical protein
VADLDRAGNRGLEDYVSQPLAVEQYEALMARLQHVVVGRKFTREEMDEIFIVDKWGVLA